MPRKRIDVEEKVNLLRGFYRKEHRFPGYKEMLELFGYASKNAVFQVINRLAETGYIEKNSDGKISPTTKLTGAIRILGTVQAGFPSPADEELVDTLSLDEFLIEKPEATFMLTVSGDSMQDAGIQPGDLVLVEKGRSPREGDIVIAAVDGEWTMKYFARRNGDICLEPANRRYHTIHPSHSLEIGGVVRSVVRKYA
jgi:SOS regulatory protein LexA